MVWCEEEKYEENPTGGGRFISNLVCTKVCKVV